MNLQARISEIFGRFLDAHSALMLFVTDVKRACRDISKEHDEIIRKIDPTRKSSFGGKANRRAPRSIQIELTKAQWTLLRDVVSQKAKSVESYPDLLARLAFIYVVALFDAFLSETFSTVLTYCPEAMSTSKKQLTYDSIIKMYRSNELIQFMATREVNENSYGSIRDQARYCQERLGIDLSQSRIQISQLTDIRAARNILLHNNGIVNSAFLEAVPSSTYKLGDQLKVTASDVSRKGKQLLTVARFL